MSPNPNKSERGFAKLMTAACIRRGYLEKLHSGTTPTTRIGDYSDVKVIDADGREMPWNQVSRIDHEEMKTQISGTVNGICTFLARIVFSRPRDLAFEKALERTALSWTKGRDEPRYLEDFLMPVKENSQK